MLFITVADGDRRTPEAVLTLIKKGGASETVLVLALRNLRRHAHSVARQAAEYICQNPKNYPEKVLNIARDIPSDRPPAPRYISYARGDGAF